MIKGTLHIPLYNCKIVACFDEDINDFSRQLYKKYKHDVSDEDENYHVVIPTDNVGLYYVLFSIPNLNMNYFTHEVFHLGIRILADRNHPLNEDDEPFSHLCGYIAGEIEKIMMRNGIELIKPKIRKKKKKDGETTN